MKYIFETESENNIKIGLYVLMVYKKILSNIFK